jgi:hypothetical protein
VGPAIRPGSPGPLPARTTGGGPSSAYSALDRELRGDRAEPWRGWELLRVATTIADRLGERGYAVLWQRPDMVEREALYSRGKKLVALMKECWPDEIRRRP